VQRNSFIKVQIEIGTVYGNGSTKLVNRMIQTTDSVERHKSKDKDKKDNN
jgi:hypothetical protein